MNQIKKAPEKHIRDLLKEKDAFLTTSEKVYEFILRHTRALAFGAAAVALAVIVGFAYVRSQKAAEEAAEAAYEEALAAASPEALEKIQHSGRRAGRLAALALIRLHIEAGAPEKALPLAENMLQTLKPAEISLKPLLLDNLAGLYETVQDYPKAAQSYETLLDWPSLSGNYKPNVLLALGRVRSAAGQPEEAMLAYEEALATASPEALEKIYHSGRRAGRPAGLALIRLHIEAGAPGKAIPLAENLLKTLKPVEISLKP
ncbi:MAG: tetratricopeptide repeat protein, partial [Candidatus Adiutrix sp.]|nr:tetratricopeptide repeat protein [Candidatus Adiutrix sp.]